MDAVGIVKAVKGNMIEVEIPRKSACGDNCASCGMCNMKDAVITVKNTPNAKAGDRVHLLADDSSFVKRAAVGYLLLTVMLIVGGVIGNLLGGEWMSFLCGILAALLTLLLFRKFFKKEIEIEIVKSEGN